MLFALLLSCCYYFFKWAILNLAMASYYVHPALFLVIFEAVSLSVVALSFDIWKILKKNKKMNAWKSHKIFLSVRVNGFRYVRVGFLSSGICQGWWWWWWGKGEKDRGWKNRAVPHILRADFYSILRHTTESNLHVTCQLSSNSISRICMAFDLTCILVARRRTYGSYLMHEIAIVKTNVLFSITSHAHFFSTFLLTTTTATFSEGEKWFLTKKL